MIIYWRNNSFYIRDPFSLKGTTFRKQRTSFSTEKYSQLRSPVGVQHRQSTSQRSFGAVFVQRGRLVGFQRRRKRQTGTSSTTPLKFKLFFKHEFSDWIGPEENRIVLEEAPVRPSGIDRYGGSLRARFVPYSGRLYRHDERSRLRNPHAGRLERGQGQNGFR